MKTSYHQIKELARLAREGCAYRGRSQQAERAKPIADDPSNQVDKVGSKSKLLGFR